MTLCSPWVDTLTLCDEDDFKPGQLDRALLAASWLLYTATGSRWPGLCTDVVRPCTTPYPSGLMQTLRRPGGGPGIPLWLSYSKNRWDWWGAPCGCSSDVLGCGCEAHSNVRMPGTPVVDVTEALVDGVDVTDAVDIVDDRWLIRTDGGRWPCCQDLTKDPDEVGTWQITYQYGAVPDEAGQIAAEVLACELAKGWINADDCRLPRRLTSITREGITMSVLDPFQFLDEGLFGLYEVDTFVTTANQGRRPGDTGGKVLMASELNAIHRVR